MPIFARFTRFCDLGAFAQNERSRLLWFREGNNLIFPQIPSNFTCQSIRQAKVLACFRVNFCSGCVRYTSETSGVKIFYIHAFLNVPQWERSGLFKRRFSNLDFCLFSLSSLANHPQFTKSGKNKKIFHLHLPLPHSPHLPLHSVDPRLGAVGRVLSTSPRVSFCLSVCLSVCL